MTSSKFSQNFLGYWTNDKKKKNYVFQKQILFLKLLLLLQLVIVT